jgi:MFS family permease
MSEPDQSSIPWRLVFAMCGAQILAMIGFASFPALLPTFIAEWQLTNTEAGWVSGLYFAGYMGAVPILVGLTDRIDPRAIFLFSAALGAFASIAFVVYADGLWSAAVLRALAGAGLAGTYMPGLKVLSDRFQGPKQSRAVSYYTSSFSVGAGVSFILAGELGAWLGWQWAFAASGIGCVIALAIVVIAVRPFAPPARDKAAALTRLLDFRPVLRNRIAMGYVLAYGAHAWELLGQRAWIVAFLLFSQSLQPEGAGWLISATLVAGLINLFGVPASILGNEFALRFGRVRLAVTAGLISAGIGCAIGFAAPLPYLLVVGLCILYGMANYADSSTVTAGAVTAATPGFTGATMAVHSFVGFAGGFLGSLVFGVVLDHAGDGNDAMAWGLGFASLGLAAALGPIALLMLSRRDTSAAANPR